MSAEANNSVTLKVSDIDMGERLRPVDPDYARLLADSIRGVGLRQPIEVFEVESAPGRYELISGAHRLTAVRILGLDTIQGVIVTGDAAKRELLQIDENLCRHDLNELDRSIFVARRRAIWVTLHPETGRGKRPAGKRDTRVPFTSHPETGSRPAGKRDTRVPFTSAFAEDAAERLGLTPRSINRLAWRADRLIPELRAALRDHPARRSGRELDALARLSGGDQLAVTRELGKFDFRAMAAKGVPPIKQLIAAVTNKPPRPSPDIVQRALTLILKMSDEEWERCLKAARAGRKTR